MAFLPPIHSFPALISALLMSLAISGCQTDIDVPPDESVVPGNSANEASEQETNEQEESSAEDGSTADANNSDGAADTDDSATNTDDSATTESSTSESPDTSDSSEATDDTNSETNDETVADANDETTGDETTDDETTDDETTGDETSGDESSDDTPSSSETANDDLAEDETTTAANDEEEPVVLLTLSGTLSASDGVILDLDINDANAGLGDNNDPANAQVLASTAVVLGFATAHATEGEISDEPDSENFARIADVDDYFLVALEAGQIIRLDIADSGTMPNGDKYLGDLDLYLFAASDDSALLYRSNGTGNQELIQVTEAGNYLVNVNAFSGASNYRLTLMPATSTSAASAADDFASNQVLVRPVSISLPFGSSKEQVRQSYSTRAIEAVQSLSGQSNGAQILAQKPLGQRFTLMTLSAPLSAQQDPLQAFNATIYEKRTTLQQVKQLAQVADIAIAEPNYYRQALAIPRDTYYGYQWSLPAIELPGAWDYSEGDDVIVAVIDSGVHLAHPELSGQLLPGYDFISSAYNSNDGDGIDSNPNDPGDSTQPGYSSWHGTHVSGIIAAASNNNSGIAGIAPNSQIMPLRALGLYGGTSSDILQALYYAAGMVNASGTVPARRADIINLSLGGESWSSIEQEAYQDVEDAGVIMVAAAGNSASTVPMYPASYSSVLSVSAVDAEDELADYSNRGAYIDIAAPGGDVSADRNFDSQPDGILSLFVDDLSGNQRATYAFMDGTSMAAPHVAGVLALVKSAYPELTPAQLKVMLANGDLTDDLGTNGRDNSFGYGRINAAKAVTNALLLASYETAPVTDEEPESTTPDSEVTEVETVAEQEPEPPVRLVVSSQLISLSSSVTSDLFTLSNSGGGNPVLESMQSDAEWLETEPVNIDSNGFGQYRILANTAELESGLYATTLTLETREPSQGSHQISLTVQLLVTPAIKGGELAPQYVLLTDTDGKVIAETLADADGDYQFEDIEPGRYQLIAGSDMDVDLSVCDAGETCGRYLDNDSNRYFDLDDQDLTGMDFIIDIQSSEQTDFSRSISQPATSSQLINENAGFGLQRNGTSNDE